MTWTLRDKEFLEEDIDDAVGFVYLIENLETGRSYIGKKGFYRSKTYQKNNKKRRKKVLSDWKNYYGSSEELKNDVKQLGKDRFKRTILRICYSKSEMNYYELREQMVRDVLLQPNEYYNSYIGTRINRNQLSERMLIS